MPLKLKLKALFILLICIASLYLVLPNFINSSFFANKQKINLGLDLKGGSHLLLQVDFKSYMKDKIYNLSDDIRQVLLKKKIPYQGLSVESNEIIIKLNDKHNYKDIVSQLSSIDKNLNVSYSDTQALVSYYSSYLDNLYNDVVNESISNVRRRLDNLGTKEIAVQKQGKDKISLQVPGIQDTAQIKSLLGKTAKLTFHLLANVSSLKDINPLTTVVMKDMYGLSYPVLRKVEISGDELSGASVGFNSVGKAAVHFKFNSTASKKFAKITTENINKPFAILLDNMVLTTPVIREPILSGQGEISGNFTMSTANELAVLLRSGALPAPLYVIEERSIGPSLGAESITSGKIAAILSIVLVSLFMIISYNLFGVLAVIALIFNIVFILLILTLIQSTLTLPGIAGITLTIGMSVDANVLIFERIREEIKSKKKVVRAVEMGFRNAMATILDSNITTLIAAAIMFAIGSGPISGFAVTLSIGILSSMFSAITITKLLIDLWVAVFKPQNLSAYI